MGIGAENSDRESKGVGRTNVRNGSPGRNVIHWSGFYCGGGDGPVAILGRISQSNLVSAVSTQSGQTLSRGGGLDRAAPAQFSLS
jgi:hypothetical protein